MNAVNGRLPIAGGPANRLGSTTTPSAAPGGRLRCDWRRPMRLRHTLTGNAAAVQAVIDAGARIVGQKGMLVNKVAIPSPRPELLNETI